VVKASGEAEYKRFLDFLAASTSTEKTVLLSNQDNQQRGAMRETSRPAPVQSASPMVRHSRGYEHTAEVSANGVINFAPDARSTRILTNDSEQITNQLAGELSTAFAPPDGTHQSAIQSLTQPSVQSPTQLGATTSVHHASTQAVPRFTTHLSADFASQMAAEFQKVGGDSHAAAYAASMNSQPINSQPAAMNSHATAMNSQPASMNSLAALVEPDQGVFTIESVSLFEEPLTASMQSASQANLLSAQVVQNQLSAQAASHLTDEPVQFISQAANMLEEWFGKLGADDDETSDDNELVDGPTYASRNAIGGTVRSTGIASYVADSTASGFSGSGAGFSGSAAEAAGVAGTMDSSGSAGSTEGGSTEARTPGSLISRLSRISKQELNAIREASLPRQKASKRTPPSRSARGQGRKHWLRPSLIPMDNGNRKELYASGAAIVKDAVGRVCEVSAANGASLTFTYDPEGHLNGFVRSNVSGKVHSTGGRDKHGVVVRDTDGRVRAQGESMSVDPRGCLSIRRFDGQFWCLDLVRGIHLERRILQDLDGQWNSLTALLTSDGFRMVTRFQKLADTTESYRRYGDWLSSETSKFRFYGRDGSVIQFDSDEDLQSLRPARIWAPGSRPIDEEWQGIRQAGTAWDSVHQYVSQYLSTL
jgi:hypothetical protein